MDLEIALVKAFGWSLDAIDRTSVESLLPFLRRFNAANSEPGQVQARRVYCDDPAAKWL